MTSRLVVIGDSFSTVLNKPAAWTWDMWPTIVGERLGLDVDNRAIGGSGYCQQSIWWNPPSRWVRQVVNPPAAPADVVVVFGGVNDRPFTVAEIRAAASDTMYAVKAVHPAAKLVVVGPQWGATTPDPVLKSVEVQVSGAASEVGADYYADPVGNRWLDGRFDLMDLDVFHPNAGGQLHLADIMAEILRPFV